jgi:hypothetical protein
MEIGDDDDPFFPKAGRESFAILNYCYECPVKVECKAKGDALNAEFGVWGGERRTKNAS